VSLETRLEGDDATYHRFSLEHPGVTIPQTSSGVVNSVAFRGTETPDRGLLNDELQHEKDDANT